MRNKSVFSTLVTAWITVPSVILFLCSGSTRAQTSSTTYGFVVASGFLCNSGDSDNCPAVAKSANGDNYEISGAGTFNTQNTSIMAAGTFNHKATNGTVLETGVWTASELISFGPYGAVPAVLSQKGQVFGRPQFGPRGLATHYALIPTGGLATIRILLIPISGAAKTAVLQINCAMGDVPQERSVEGIRITFERSNSEYSEEAGGRVMFLAQRPELRTPAKVSEDRVRPVASEQPQKVKNFGMHGEEI